MAHLSLLRQKILGPAGLFLAAATLGAIGAPSYRQGGPSPLGQNAREFEFHLAGHPAHLSDLRGKVILLDFWASWCPPCLEEAESLNRLKQDISERGGIVLAISEDEDQTAYDSFIQVNRIDFLTYRDPTKKIKESYGTVMIPEAYLIDRQGRLVRKFVGAQNWQSPEFMASINALLNQN
jgi:cytochrome c biogenesis protein CcmG/thiol:disulfide interchange protein DsbE